MDLLKIREHILGSNDITIIAPKSVIGEILLQMTCDTVISLSTKYDIEDDNILMLNKLHIKNTKIIVDTAILKDGRLKYNDGDKLLIEESTFKTMKRLGVDNELIERYKSFSVFKA